MILRRNIVTTADSNVTWAWGKMNALIAKWLQQEQEH